MFAPIGSFLTRMDGALTAGTDGIVTAMVSYMATPIALSAVLYYILQGIKLANGDSSPLRDFVPQLIRVGTVIWLSSNLDAFNYWVRDVFFTGLPNALAGVVASSTGPAANSVTNTAAIFDAVWSQVWAVIGLCWMQIGFSVTGVLAGLTGLMTGLAGGLGLVVMALVYLAARFTLGVIVCMAPVLIGCAMFDATRPIFERAVGKVVALIILQVAAFIVLQIVLLGNQWFMAQATTAILAATGGAAVFAEAIQIMVAIAVWFVAGAYVMLNLPPIAYSIGSGIALSGPSRSQRLPGGGGGTPEGGGGIAAPANLSLALARPALSSGEAAALPPPPPPSIVSSSRS